MATPTIPNGEEQFFPIIYEGNGTGQRVGKFVPFTDSGTIANSVIFNDGDSAYLSRTPSGTGNRRTFTFSGWVKRGVFNTSNGNDLFNAGTNPGNNVDQLLFDSSNRIRFYSYGGSYLFQYITNRTFEDTSKWYHIVCAVDTTQSTASDRVKIYVDGDLITSFSTETDPALNGECFHFNNTSTHYIGANVGSQRFYDGYIAEYNFVDGQQLTPDTFGLTDTSTGRWIPKALTGITYGTNGFRLQFGTSSALGDDTSGNTNDFSVSNLVAGDQTTDSPTQNFNTFGSVFSGVTVSEGNLTVNTGTSGSYIQAVGQPAFGVATGKWYWEVKITTVGKGLYGWKDDESQGGSQANQGATSASGSLSTGSSGSFSAGSWFIDMDYSNEVNYTTVSTNDVLMFAIDLDSGKGYCGKNGTFFNSANPANGTGSIGGCHRANGINKFYPCANRLDTASVGEFNFGQKSFAYTPPTGFSALQQDNLPETDKGISGFSWIKSRDTASAHMLFDSNRGPQLRLKSDSASSEVLSQGTVTKFLKGGYAVGNQTAVNKSDDSIVSYNWVANGGTTVTNNDGALTSTVQANTTAGFSIITYTGNGVVTTIGHGLSQAPEWFIIFHRGSLGSSNYVYHKSIGADYMLFLNLNNARDTSVTTPWNDTAPTSSVINLMSTGYGGNNSGEDYLIYAWHGVEGFSKFGKYTGNGVSDGPFVYTGFKPAWLLVKSNNAANWYLCDAARSTMNPVTDFLHPDRTDADYTNFGRGFDFLSNGFKLRQESGYGANYSGVDTYYMAFAEHPFVGDGTNPVTAR